MKKEKFNISGMSCAACSSRIENKLRKLSGVQLCNVNLLNNYMNVEYDEKLINVNDIIENVERLGYKASSVNKEAENVKVKKGFDSNLENDKLKLIFSFIFLFILMYVSMAHMFFLPLPDFLINKYSVHSFAFTQFLLVLPIIYLNKKYYENGIRALFRLAPNMDSLIAIGSGAALLHGIFSLYFIGINMAMGKSDLNMQIRMNLYFESVGMILCLVSLGKFLEGRSKLKTGDAISKLIDLSPQKARIIKFGKEIEIDSKQVKKGDILIVRQGEKIAVDGIVIEGNASIDESIITGESIPVEKNISDKLITGTINLNGILKYEALNVGEDTTIAKIVKLVEEASMSKAPISSLADKIAGIFVPAVILIAIFTFLYYFIVNAGIDSALSNAISVLVISCPCALGLATPVAIMVATGKGATNGILLKNAKALQMMNEINTIVLDKTGTITVGKPKLVDIVNLSKLDKNIFLKLAASIEAASNHPLSNAIVEYAEEKNIKISEVKDFEIFAGRGISASLDNDKLYAGNLLNLEQLIKEGKIENDKLDEIKNIFEELSGLGKTPMFFSKNKEVIGILAVEDSIKKDSKQAIDILKKKKIDIIMLTGDNKNTALAIATQVGISNIISDVLPMDKEKKIFELIKSGKKVAMVGDGINDAPALARANVGVAIGSGMDIAIDCADIVLMNSSLMGVIKAIDLSKSTIINIKENLFWAFIYNILCIPLAAGVFSGLGFTLNPMIASLAMSLSSIFVVSNALRLRNIKFEYKREDNEYMNIELKVDGMMCEHCKKTVEGLALEFKEINSARVDLNSKSLDIECNKAFDVSSLKNKLNNSGYKVID